MKMFAVRTFACLLYAGLVGQLCADDGTSNRPQVINMLPSYGPIDGGTNLILFGKNLSVVEMVLFENISFVFNISFQNDSFILCVTERVPEALAGYTGPLILVSGNDNHAINQSFTYKPSPVIENIKPGAGIVSGGIEQTITGTNLDSAYVPKMTMTLVYQYDHIFVQDDHPGTEITNRVCHVINSTCMTCKSKPFSKKPLETLPPWNPLRTEEMKFWLSFTFDGATYRNVSEFIVYQDPVFNKLTDDMLLFKVYKGQTEIEIEGNNFNVGITKDHYTIIIGNGTTPSGDDSLCEITYFITNLLRCKPPQEKPYTTISKYGEPSIVIEVGYLRHHVGYLKYELTFWDDPSMRNIVISVVCVVVLLVVLVLVVLVYVKRRRRSDNQQSRKNNVYTRSPGLWSRLLPQTRTQLQPCLKDEGQLSIGKEIGKGHFGSVYAAKFLDTSGTIIMVAAKTIKDTEVTPQELEEFLQEALIMRHFDDVNVLGLVGVVFKAGRPFVLIPFMDNGDLKTYLRNPNNTFTVGKLLDYGLQIAKGMCHISEKNFIHRDLAARNCMIDINGVVKIADFGLARSIQQKDYYRIADSNRPLPIKWMAVECMSQRRFTVHSDVWSYGVVLWELMTRCKVPYADVDNAGLKNYLMSGTRLEIPELTPPDVAQLMRDCWKAEPSSRPLFKDAVVVLERVLADDGSASDPDVESRPYETLNRQRAAIYLTRVNPTYTNLDDTGASRIDYLAAREAFDDIPDPGYLKPISDGYVNDCFRSEDEPTTPTSANSGYVSMNGSERNETQIETEEIQLRNK